MSLDEARRDAIRRFGNAALTPERRVRRARDLTIFKLSGTLVPIMDTFSTRQAAKMLGIGVSTLSRYIAAGKVPAPRTVQLGGLIVHAWTEREIERARKLIPKIQNGRHLRYQKQREENGKKPL